jgi:hypothetical protein
VDGDGEASFQGRQRIEARSVVAKKDSSCRRSSGNCGKSAPVTNAGIDMHPHSRVVQVEARPAVAAMHACTHSRKHARDRKYAHSHKHTHESMRRHANELRHHFLSLEMPHVMGRPDHSPSVCTNTIQQLKAARCHKTESLGKTKAHTPASSDTESNKVCTERTQRW